MVIQAFLTFIDHALDLFNVTVQKVQLSHRSLNPRAAVDPKSPLVVVHNDWGGLFGTEIVSAQRRIASISGGEFLE
jgi:hypothetical protein